MRPERLATCALIASGMSLASWPSLAGPAVGQFEVKTLNSEPGEIEFQSQNAYAFGNPRRKVVRDASGELEADDNSLSRQRNALELEFGLTPFLKTRIGVEYEKERREDPETPRHAEGYENLKLDEYAAEVIWIMIPRRGSRSARSPVTGPSTKNGSMNMNEIMAWSCVRLGACIASRAFSRAISEMWSPVALTP